MLTSHELFGFMSPSVALDILTHAYETDKPLYRTAVAAVAEARKLRPVFLERQPRQQRHTTMVSTLTRPALDLVSGNLIRAWLLKKHQAMLVDFLNALEIAHQEGVVENLPESMDEAKLKGAVEVLLGKYPPETVAVYLHAFSEMNEVDWPNLKAMLDAEPRLQLGATG